ncbi:DUF6290 family protein [Anaerococcus sp. NML200574]|uniref:DUF6290 family protein n=1 Tax=Anaerococcus sp. NML200574 TaxID=2954486 RepID=UPI00223804A5|nr:DUF6290 family protein [Anaerococcus sp. NML200574]MCW6677756.1 DUF6290 family protein [Anaerococcus sp. NML200574]
MNTLKIEFSDEEIKSLETLAKQENLSLAAWARYTLIEKIKEDFDNELIKDYLLNKDKMKFYSGDQVKLDLGI